MTSVSTVLAELDAALASRSEDQRAQTAARVTDMFVAYVDNYSPDQIGVFDVVIGRLAAGIGPEARTDLSERLADLSNGPRGVIRQLALDELVVARPVLTRSVCLSDQDLIAVASTKGRDHMLAITERPNLNEPVTDYLVVKGDKAISQALAINLSAKFSGRGMGLLVTRSFSDEVLQTALTGRADIPEELMVNLGNAVRESARRRLMGKTATGALLAGAPTASTSPQSAIDPAAMEAAFAGVRDLKAERRLDEAALAKFATGQAAPQAICALALLAEIGVPAAEQAVLGADRDAVLVIGKALGWDWSTVKALIGLRPAGEQLPHMIDRAASNFEQLSVQTAQRVIKFMRVKEQIKR